MVTEYPLAWSSLANDAANIPFPNDEVTPPVTNMYFVFLAKPNEIYVHMGLKIRNKNQD